VTIPTPEEILEGLELDPEPDRGVVEDVLVDAVRVAEVLLRTAILPRMCREEVMLGGPQLTVLLSQFPVHDVTVDGAPPGATWWAEGATGCVGSRSLAPSSYNVYFRVGHEGHVPAIYREVILRLVRRRLGVPGGTADLPVLAEAGRKMLEKERLERDRVRCGR
jgi:hypothetical protein